MDMRREVRLTRDRAIWFFDSYANTALSITQAALLGFGAGGPERPDGM